MIPISSINGWPNNTASGHFAHCCGAKVWIEAMLAQRPFATEASLLAAVDQAFSAMKRADWLEAFRHHPKIGDLKSLGDKFASTAHLASGEQAGVKGADQQVLTDLLSANQDYERRFGYIFIVCATGKSAAEMLTILKSRLNNPEGVELEIAAREQRQITRLRLEKLSI